MMAIVTNIDADHMETYHHDFEKLRRTFIEFLHHLPFYGVAVVCSDDPEINIILSRIQRPTLTYGFNDEANYKAKDWVQSGLQSQFRVIRPAPHKELTIQLKSPGKHNVLNALAAIAIATELKISDEAIISGLAKFAGVGRRFQLVGERSFLNGKARIVDDYGHHPREIKATIEAFRAVWPDKRLIHVFQPHRYSRTQALFTDFVDVLQLADELLLFDIYSAGEPVIEGVTSLALMQALQKKSQKVALVTEKSLVENLERIIRDGDIILMQGAGNIGQLAANLIVPN